MNITIHPDQGLIMTPETQAEQLQIEKLLSDLTDKVPSRCSVVYQWGAKDICIPLQDGKPRRITSRSVIYTD